MNYNPAVEALMAELTKRLLLVSEQYRDRQAEWERAQQQLHTVYRYVEAERPSRNAFIAEPDLTTPLRAAKCLADDAYEACHTAWLAYMAAFETWRQTYTQCRLSHRMHPLTGEYGGVVLGQWVYYPCRDHASLAITRYSIHEPIPPHHVARHGDAAD